MTEHITIPITKLQTGFSEQTLACLDMMSADGWEVVQVVDSFILMRREIKKEKKAKTKNA